MTVSIIIAVKTWQKNLEECVDKCLELDYPDFEILILPDCNIGTVPVNAKANFLKGAVPIQVIPTGAVSPARKRDIAMEYARGEIFAFIDDDAYPAKGWLKNAVKNFIDPEVAAVGGPAVTALDDNIKQKASGAVYSSLLVSAQFSYRYVPKKRRMVEDFPSCNFLVRKSIMQELGGFRTELWPGEDTKLCLNITKRLGKRIIYDPEVLVYHHRRPLFVPHLKQVANYALQRGYFAKKYPETSLKLPYFIPSLLLFVLTLGGITSLFLIAIRIIYFFGLISYLFLVFMFSIYKELRLTLFIFSGVILTQLTYGIYFLKGLLSRRLKE